jgi:hypothetical protein
MATTASVALLAGAAHAQSSSTTMGAGSEGRTGTAVCNSTVMSPAYQNCTMPVPNANVAGQGSFPGSFLVPGTSTSFAVHGILFAEIDKEIGTHSQGDTALETTGNFQGWGASQPQLASHAQNGGIEMGDKATRPNIETRTPTAYGELKTYIEFDFNQTAGTMLAANADVVRLRQAYGTLGPWLAGQTKSLFDDIQVYPDLADAGLDAGMRQSSTVHIPQLRYTYLIGGGMLVAGAVQLPQKDGVLMITPGGTAGTAITEDEFGTATNTSLVQIPDFAARFQIDQPWGHVGVNGLLHQINIRNTTTGVLPGAQSANFQMGGSTGGFKKQNEGEAIAVTGHLNTFGRDRLAGGVEWIRGIAGAANSMTADAIVNLSTGAMDPLTEYAVYGSYEHFFNGQWRSNASFGYAKAINNIGVLGFGNTSDAAGIVRRQFTTHLNIIYSPVPMLDITTEWVHFEVNQRSSASFTENRIIELARFYF